MRRPEYVEMSRTKKTNLHDIAESALLRFKGDIHLLESAIGSLYVGKQYGWKVIYLIHDKKTIRKYEDVLKINFRQDMPEIGPRADHSVAFRALQNVTNFWKAVKGEIPGIRTPEVT